MYLLLNSFSVQDGLANPLSVTTYAFLDRVPMRSFSMENGDLEQEGCV